MDAERIWLVVNEASGSTNDDALSSLRRCCGDHGFTLDREICFPGEDIPTPADLDRAGIGTLAVFAGDGTINHTITTVYGWGGAVLVLPGGTMNLLCQRLHGIDDLETIVARAGCGSHRRVRPTVVRCAYGDAFAGLLAGPGTAWNHVREALRESDYLGMLREAADAFAQSTGGSMVASIAPAAGKPQGYPMLQFEPMEDGLELCGFHAETAGEFMQQGAALMRHNFRDGPHDRLGIRPRFTIRDTDGNPIGMLLDGEPAEGTNEETIEMARCEVDLLATTDG